MAEIAGKNSVSARPAGILPDRAQPHNLKVEQAVLSAMFRDPKGCIDTVVSKLGTTGDAFYGAANRSIYMAVVELHRNDSVPDLLSVAQKLQASDKLEAAGGELYLAEIYSAIATAVNVESWCDILRNYAMLRRMIDACSGALLKCYDNDADPDKLVEEIETDIYHIRTAGATEVIRDLRQLVVQEFKTLMDIQNRNIEVGIPTGYAPLDDFTGGLKKGEMFVLAARPSIGKTSLGLNIISNVAIKGANRRPVAFFSLEMTDNQIARRLLCSESGIPESVFWNGTFNDSDMVKLTSAVANIREAKLFIDPTGGLTISELRAKARRLKNEHDIQLIVIDYLQLMHADSRVDGRQQEVAEISGGIKKLAKDLDVPVLVLAQLNREIDKNTSANARPKLAHLRESGAIEQDADIVTFLHRNRDDAKNLPDGASTEAELIVEKNRNGKTGVVKLNFYPSRMLFEAAPPVGRQYAPGGEE
ncbi:MAG: replicative DNA helicase [Lentisphaeria bacterium]|nr:replicative DNA helicase [Lentisphaeria bacterium]